MPSAREVMTVDPVCCVPTDPVTRVAQIMKQEDVGSVPVVDSSDSKRLVGIVTDRDLVIKVLAGGSSVEQATVQDAMTSDPASVTEGDDAGDAVALMAERQVRRMPVVDERGRVVGIIAQADVATRLSHDSSTGQMVESISESSLSRD